MILLKGSPGWIEIITGVEQGVPEELESIAVKGVAAGLGDDANHPAVVVAVFGVEIVGEDAQLLDGIEVGNDRGSAVHMLLHVDGIHHEAVSGFALAVDGNVAGIRVARRIDRAGDAGHDHRGWGEGGHRSDARLDGEQVRIAAAIQGNGLDLCCGKHCTKVRGDGVHLGLECFFGFNDCDSLVLPGQLHYRVDAKGGVGVDGEIGLELLLKSVRFHRQIVMTGGSAGNE